MHDYRPVTCQNCNWQGSAHSCKPIEPHALPHRVHAGDVMPAGECPECGSSALLDPATSQPQAHIRPVTKAENATHFQTRGKADSLAKIMAAVAQNFSYRVQDLQHHGFRVAVYKPNPNPGMYPQSYLRIQTD